MSTIIPSVNSLHVIATLAVLLALAATSPAQPAAASPYTANHPAVRESKLKTIDPATGLPVQEPFRPPANSPLGKIVPELAYQGWRPPMSEVVKRLQEEAPGANILLGEGVGELVLPSDFALRNVSVTDILTTIGNLVEPHLMVSFTDGNIATIKLAPRADRVVDAEARIVTRVFSFRGILLHDPRDVKKPSGFTEQDRMEKAAIDEVEFRDFVDKQLVEAINAAFNAERAARATAGLPAGHESRPPQISSHVPTRLVIVSGDYRSVEVASQVIDAMIGASSPGAKPRTAPAPILPKTSP